jgi:lipoprotein-anchoring transpeptidase ErfK/SrfK
MHGRKVQLLAVVLAASLAGVAAAPAQARRGPSQSKRSAPSSAKRSDPTGLPCGNVLAFQILLDRQNFSPGQIDGKTGANFSHALAAIQAAHKLPKTGKPDCQTWRALGGERAGDLLAPYTVTDEDANATYVPDIPNDLDEQAKLPALEYQSLQERLAERFHAAPALLEQLNPGAAMQAGTTIKVPAVTPFDPAKRPASDATATGLRVIVSRDDSGLRVTKADGTVVLFAPVTTGSEHDPLPPGNWKVTAVEWMPAFHYNPDLFWDAKPDQTRATIKPGPNNPVGVVWIDLDLEHYGLHGTPEPGNVGHTASHGCVRLTNWDAARVTALIKAGTPVQFR